VQINQMPQENTAYEVRLGAFLEQAVDPKDRRTNAK